MGLFIFPGDLFRTRCQVLVCPVNCSGTVEKGLMGRLRKRIPAAFQDYQQRCGRREIKIGCPYLFSASSPLSCGAVGCRQPALKPIRWASPRL